MEKNRDFEGVLYVVNKNDIHDSYTIRVTLATSKKQSNQYTIPKIPRKSSISLPTATTTAGVAIVIHKNLKSFFFFISNLYLLQPWFQMGF